MRDHGRVCPWWLAWTFDNPLRRWLHDPERILGDYVKEGMTVADIGCGMGYFSVALARRVGAKGRVLAIDVQARMLRSVERRARRAGVAERIVTVLASEDDLGITGPVDFVLAFWMVHEVKDVRRLFKQLAATLGPRGRLLCAEPRRHVSEARFSEIIARAADAGFRVVAHPRVRWSRAAVLMRGGRDARP